MIKSISTVIIILYSIAYSFAATYTFTGNGNWSNQTLWDTYPPNIILSGDEVIIDGNCSLDLPIIVNGNLIVNSNYTFIIDDNYQGEYIDCIGKLIVKNSMTVNNMNNYDTLIVDNLGNLDIFGILSTNNFVNYGNVNLEQFENSDVFINYGSSSINIVSYCTECIFKNGSSATINDFNGTDIYANGQVDFFSTTNFDSLFIGSTGVLNTHFSSSGSIVNSGQISISSHLGNITNLLGGQASFNCNNECDIDNYGMIDLSGSTNYNINNSGFMNMHMNFVGSLFNEDTLVIDNQINFYDLTNNGNIQAEQVDISVNILNLEDLSKLEGNATYNVDNIYTSTNSTVSPGNSPGNIDFIINNPYYYEGQINYEIFSFASNDNISFEGADVIQNATFNVSFENGFVPYIGQEIVIIEDPNQYIDPSSTPVLNLPSGYTYAENLFQFNNQLSFTVLTNETIPKIGLNTQEPKSALHIALGDLFLGQEGGGVIIKDLDGQCYKTFIGETGEIGSGDLGLRLSPIACPDD